jgi:alkanesulfonate monooxygenase SsuD/methylene tetrahydromethanopterin reductase-like flavin-dependent oxidoreductase (luciferase family)
MELGLYTFADVGPEIDPAQLLHNLLEEIELADQLGLDVFGVGEHHRPDYAVSSPAVATRQRSLVRSQHRPLSKPLVLQIKYENGTQTEHSLSRLIH